MRWGFPPVSTGHARRPAGSAWIRVCRAEEGQDLAEYGMLAALIAVVVILAVAALGTTLANLWGNITTAFAALP